MLRSGRPPWRGTRRFEAWTFDSALAEARKPSQRARWRLYKTFPHLLQPAGADGLTAEQELLAIAHTVLDEGRDHCPECAELVEAALFCSECGAQLHEARSVRECGTEGCGYRGTARFCPRDGARVIPEAVERVNAGKTTWSAEIDGAWAAASANMPPSRSPDAHARDLAAMMGE